MGYEMQKKIFKCFIIIITIAILVLFGNFESIAQIESKSQNAILVDQISGNVMWSKNAYKKAYPASTTKIMTAIIYYEKFKDDLYKTVTVGNELSKLPAGSSIMGLEKDEIVTREQLLYGLMLVSGNDAAIVMAYDHSGGIPEFANEMNKKAKEYGMESTNFVNPHGFHDDNHYTTAADFAILTREYMKYDYLRVVANRSIYDMAATNKKEKFVMHNSNRLISVRPEYKKYLYDDATGLKTGFTNMAKNCFVATASNGLTGLIFVGFGYETPDYRFIEAKTLMEHGFTNFSPINVYDNIKNTRVFADASSFNIPEYQYGNVDSLVQINAKEVVSVEKDIAGKISSSNVSASFRPSIKAKYPIKDGDFIGHIEYYFEDTIIYTAKAYATKYLEDRKIPKIIKTAIANNKKADNNKSFFQNAVDFYRFQNGTSNDKVNDKESKTDNTQTDATKDNTTTNSTTSKSTTSTSTKSQTNTSSKSNKPTNGSTKGSTVSTNKKPA